MNDFYSNLKRAECDSTLLTKTYACVANVLKINFLIQVLTWQRPEYQPYSTNSPCQLFIGLFYIVNRILWKHRKIYRSYLVYCCIIIVSKVSWLTIGGRGLLPCQHVSFPVQITSSFGFNELLSNTLRNKFLKSRWSTNLSFLNMRTDLTSKHFENKVAIIR